MKPQRLLSILAAPSIVVLSLGLSIAPSVIARDLEIAHPTEIGLAADKLQELTAYLQSEVDAGRVAGAVGLVARHGRIGYFEAVGLADREKQRAMQEEAIFRIASMTKAVTTVAALQLVEEGTISLDDPLSKFLPAFASMKVLAADATGGDVSQVDAERPITIRHLLTHTSGLAYGWFGPAALDALYASNDISDVFVPTDETMRDRVERLAKLPLKYQPGTALDYSLAIDVLGVVIEEASGLTLAQYFRERIFRPLRMRDSHFFVPESKLDRLAALYTPAGEESRLERVESEVVTAGTVEFTSDYCIAGGRRFFSGGGGLVSTALDYARFLQAILNGGELDGERVLERQTVRMMTRNQIGELSAPPFGHGDKFGFGFGVLTAAGKADDVASVGTVSWGGLFNTYYWVDPQEEIVGILMTQVFPFGHLDTRDEFKRRVYEALDDSGFSRLYWYEKGEEHANPFFNPRQLRVNAPETSVHPTFSRRSEPRSSGLARILTPVDLLDVRRVDLYCEIWGGHPGTANKRVGINGRSLYRIPEVGTVDHHCTHQYPQFNLEITDLVNGHNALQFACDRGETFWGHYIVDNACLRIGLPDTHEELVDDGLGDFDVDVSLNEGLSAVDTVRLELSGQPEDLARVSEVHYQGRYLGYDENGDGRWHDWHGLTKGREAYGHLGSATEPPFRVTWDADMLPAQESVAVRAFVELQGQPGLIYQTRPLRGLTIGKPAKSRVTFHRATDLPAPFWSRAGRKRTCTISLDVDPQSIEKAELHVVTWTGGAGSVEKYFTLNGEALPVAPGHGHEVVYTRLPLEPQLLRRGANRVELLSDTEHHGIEVLLPGPAIAVRKRIEDAEER